MTELGTIKYEIEPFGRRFRVVSLCWNRGMIGAPQWFRNFVADCGTIPEAEEIVKRLSNCQN